MIQAIEQPGMRCKEHKVEKIYSQSDLVRASLVPGVDLAAELYPSASSKPAEDKEGKRSQFALDKSLLTVVFLLRSS